MTDKEDAYIGSLLFDALREPLVDKGGAGFRAYIERHYTSRWLLFSDYVLGHPGRLQDVFAFTVLPGGVYFSFFSAAAQPIVVLRKTGG